jgi:predicted small secreted protein
MINNKERKKLMKALRGMILRYRKAGKTDKVAISTFVYEKGLTKKDADEMYQILLDAQRIQQVETVTA